MVKERSPSRTSSGQHLSPRKVERPVLANISAKMQSPSPKQSKDGGDGTPQKPQPPAQPEFGKASPLRNPLKKPEPSIFMPKQKQKQKPAHRPLPDSRPYLPARPYATQPPLQSQRWPQSQTGAGSSGAFEGRPFYLPGQRQQPPGPQYASALEAAQAYSSQPFKRSFDPAPVPIAKPTNPTLPTTQPRAPPAYSSIGGPNNTYPTYRPHQPVIDLTRSADKDEDEFDPDADIRARGLKFGEADPNMYVDSSQANENIKNLLEGAFDDDQEKSRTRLRKRAKKAPAEDDEKGAKGLAAKLSALDVKADEPKQPEETVEQEEDDGTVEGLNDTKLLPHQVEGVAWMIDKEIGVRKKKGILPNGGILADDMGLGKTVQSIALMLTNPRPALDAKPEHPKQILPGKEVSKCTLVVAPLALIKQWEEEIKTKVAKTHAMRVLVHHGASRTKSHLQLKKYDVVITTYQTLTTEHAGSNMDRPDGARIGCFGVHWYRLILDEAHSIKNRNAKSTLAACALNSWYRWCLTGTPMQNNLDELQSLIKFLRIKPYCELPRWKDAITQPMKNGKGTLAMRRLQVFLIGIMKRRTKDVLKKEGALNFGGKPSIAEDGTETKQHGMQIVKREVITVECDFDEDERAFYSRLQARADARLQQMSEAGNKDYIGALVLLLRLRQACNHPHLVEMAMNKDKDAMMTGTEKSGGSGSQTPRTQTEDGGMDALTALMGGVSVKAKQCDVCQADLSKHEMDDGAVRCGECEADLKALRKGKTMKVKKEKKVEPRQRNRRVIMDDSDDEGEGEWISKGPEQRVNLGKPDGSDDEDAEGGGETLDSIDSDRSASDDDDEEDSPLRARMRKAGARKDSDDEGSRDATDEDENENDSDSDAPAPIVRGLQRSSKGSQKPSTKIRRVLRILHAEGPKHKTIVFSQFTTMLDLIEPHLKSGNLRFARYDGSMRPDDREASLHSLRTDPKCRILLCSLKCGSLGLNLTAASRVVIIEPFWNPFVEEQAIDRVHRLNQTVDVKVYRLTVRATVEERILELQEKKRELAKAAIEGGKAVGKLSMQDIISLFRHDAEDAGDTEESGVDGDEISAKFGRDHRLLDGPDAGFEQSGKLLRKVRPVKDKAFKEHDVYGRRW